MSTSPALRHKSSQQAAHSSPLFGLWDTGGGEEVCSITKQLHFAKAQPYPQSFQLGEIALRLMGRSKASEGGAK
jgi:hypothetical protein